MLILFERRHRGSLFLRQIALGIDGAVRIWAKPASARRRHRGRQSRAPRTLPIRRRFCGPCFPIGRATLAPSVFSCSFSFGFALQADSARGARPAVTSYLKHVGLRSQAAETKDKLEVGTRHCLQADSVCRRDRTSSDSRVGFQTVSAVDVPTPASAIFRSCPVYIRDIETRTCGIRFASNLGSAQCASEPQFRQNQGGSLERSSLRRGI